MNSFSKLIYEMRKEKGWTQAELGERLNLTDKAISRWETGESMPETQQLVPLSNIFNISIDELLKGERKRIFQEIKETPGIISVNKISSKNNNFFNKILSFISSKKFLIVAMPIIVSIITLSTIFAVIKNNRFAVQELKSEVYTDFAFEEIYEEYDLYAYEKYNEFKASEFYNKVINNKPLKQKYTRYYFMNFVLLIVKFNDLAGYNYYISNMGFNNTDITIELVGSRKDSFMVNTSKDEQTYYCYINLPKKTVFPEKIEVNLSEMDIHFAISERFVDQTLIIHPYMKPDLSDIYFSDRKDFEFYIAKTKEGMDEYRVLDNGLNFTTVITDMIYQVFYNDEFFENNDLIFIQINRDSSSSTAINIIDEKVNIREYTPQINAALCNNMLSYLLYLPVSKGATLNNMETVKYRIPDVNGCMPWLTLSPPITHTRVLLATEISDNLIYYR